MKTKLTLHLSKDLIEQAEAYAESQNTSLSQLVESMLRKLIKDKIDEDISPLVRSLSGGISLPDDQDVRSDYADFLGRKYS